MDKPGFTRCVTAPQFFWNPGRQVWMEVHMDDVHSLGQTHKWRSSMKTLPPTFGSVMAAFIAMLRSTIV